MCLFPANYQDMCEKIPRGVFYDISESSDKSRTICNANLKATRSSPHIMRCSIICHPSHHHRRTRENAYGNKESTAVLNEWFKKSDEHDVPDDARGGTPKHENPALFDAIRKVGYDEDAEECCHVRRHCEEVGFYCQLILPSRGNCQPFTLVYLKELIIVGKNSEKL